MSPATMTRLPTLRPWVLRALVLTVVYGVAQTAFVALRSFSPDLMTLWSILLLGVVLAVGILWVGAEVVLDRQPPEWSWFFAALAAAPGAGLLSWILLALFVDDTGVADLGSALVGRASFTALLVLVSVGVGSRLGWLSLRRHGEGANDPALDADDDEVARQAALDRAGLTEPAIPSRATRAPREGRAAPGPAARETSGPTVAGVRTPGRRGRPEPAVEERERLPEAPRLAGERRASRVRPATETDATPAPVPATSPFGPASATADADGAEPAPAAAEPGGAAGAAADPAGTRPGRTPTRDSQPGATQPGGTDPEPVPESLAPPVVAVLPTTELPMFPVQTPPDRPATPAEPEPEPTPAEPAALRRRFGLRRPRS